MKLRTRLAILMAGHNFEDELDRLAKIIGSQAAKIVDVHGQLCAVSEGANEWRRMYQELLDEGYIPNLHNAHLEDSLEFRTQS